VSVQEKDLLLILDYVDGRLSPEAMVGLEIRFTNDPELAAAYESFETVDDLQRQVALAQARPKKLRLLRGGRHLRPMAAAALLMVAASVFLTRDKGSSLCTQVAMVPSSVAWPEFNRALGVGDEWQGRTPNPLRGSDQPEFPHGEYFARVAPIQEARLERALVEKTAPPMEYFNVALRPGSACSALVLMADATGRVVDHEGSPYAPAFPATESWTADSGRLAADRLEVLPRRNLVLNDDQRIGRYDPGFLVPMKAVRLEVLVGLRKAPLDQALRDSLGLLLSDLAQVPPTPQGTSERLRSWLREHGFEVTTSSVEEPQD
jgi:hypothetical protein